MFVFVLTSLMKIKTKFTEVGQKLKVLKSIVLGEDMSRDWYKNLRNIEPYIPGSKVRIKI